MSRKHGLLISLLLSACVVTGASAAMKTINLGAASNTSVKVPDAQIAARRAKLNKWQASLKKALATKTPALPRVPAYGPVAVQAASVSTSAQAAAAPVHAAPAARAAKRNAPASTQAQTATPQAPPVIQYVQPTAPPASYGDDGDHGDGGDDGNDH